MIAAKASLTSALVLIIVSIWAYVSTEDGSLTALIPAVFGLALLACYPGIRAANRIVAVIAVLLMLLILAALFVPLGAALERGDATAVLRALLMQVASVVPIVYLVKGLIDGYRKAD